MDYKILLKWSYVYDMFFVDSSVVCIMMFPHEDRIITGDQLTHSEKRLITNMDVILPYVDISADGLSLYQ